MSATPVVGAATRTPPLLGATAAPAMALPERAPQAGAAAHPFAELLRQNRLAEAPKSSEPSSTPDPVRQMPNAAHAQAQDGASSGARAAANASAQRDANQARARSAGASRPTARSTVPPVRPAGPAEEASGAQDEQGAEGTPASADSAVPAGAPAGARPEPAPRAAADGGASTGATGPQADSPARPATPAAAGEAADGGDATTATATAAPGSMTAGAREPRGGLPGAVAEAAAKRGVAAAATAWAAIREADAAGTAGATFAETLAESKAQSPAPPSSLLEPGSPLAAAGAAPLAEPARPATPGAQGAVASANLPVPVDSPEFAAAFGLQVSSLARDGVQHAELHLNPAEMGPVSIHITLEGSQARVDFGADLAATRQAIETGLPELASALRDAGFTLAGGGVAEHSRPGGGRGDDADPDRPTARRSGASTLARLDAAAQRATARTAVGGIDLYA
ncbi:MAG: flagellar hook-length control protein FliK [Caldimonas sp.]